MSLQPHQTRDLIIKIAREIQQVNEEYQSIIDKTRKICDAARSTIDKVDSIKNNVIDRIEETAIGDQEKIYKKTLADLEEVLFIFKKQREQMLKDLELPSDVEV